MKRVIFENWWEVFCGGHGLKNFDDFFGFSGGKIINKNNRRDVTIITLLDESGEKVFYMKRFRNPHMKDIFFALRSFGRICSQAELEWNNARLLAENKIGTCTAVCYGEQMICGFEKGSFIVTEQIQGQSLDSFVAEKWLKLSQSERGKIIVPLGRFIRRIHEAGFSMPDLYIWHIFIKQNATGDDYDFAVIDLHRMRHNVTGRTEQLKNLGRFVHSMRAEYFDDAAKNLLIESYASENWVGDIKKLKRKVKQFSDAVSRKRKPKLY